MTQTYRKATHATEGRREDGLPIYWTGVDAQQLPERKVLIDWDLLKEDVMPFCDWDGIKAYAFLFEEAMKANKEGDKDSCSYIASHALVCMNMADEMKRLWKPEG
tara:strand:+ start:261 stop:575 length:315 start_codon:yes stop_codon:yes gene_type:complete